MNVPVAVDVVVSQSEVRSQSTQVSVAAVVVSSNTHVHTYLLTYLHRWPADSATSISQCTVV